MGGPSRTRRLWLPCTIGTIGVLALMLSAGAGAGTARPHAGFGPGPAIGTPGPGTIQITGALTYNGQPTANASGPTSALGISFNTPATVEFFWQAAGGKISQPLSISIQTAELRVYFLGLSVWTKDQTLSPPSVSPKGTVNLTADFTLNRYLLEGLYELSGSLIEPNGTVAWSENFYLKVMAPNHLTAVNLGLGLVAVYEAYTIATVGRWLSGQQTKADVAKVSDEGSSPAGGDASSAPNHPPGGKA
ncbi:MAG: hypothetical protein L3K19_09310 [Thermoplasmata archaeon]|nr:hypothetical protein [Thermoplasmata archaeon]